MIVTAISVLALGGWTYLLLGRMVLALPRTR
jgi:hypothetical protein